MQALYSALLFEVVNENVSDTSIINPSEFSRIKPAPLPLLLDELSTWRVQRGEGPFFGDGAISMMKSANTCALAADLDSYLMPNSKSSIAHLIILPVRSER